MPSEHPPCSGLGLDMPFSHGETGMTRFPPNVESISVRVESSRAWLIVSRNDTSLTFAMGAADALELAKRLQAAASSLGEVA